MCDLMTEIQNINSCSGCPYYNRRENVLTIHNYGRTVEGSADLCTNPELVKKLRPKSKTIIQINGKKVNNAILRGLALRLCKQGNL